MESANVPTTIAFADFLEWKSKKLDFYRIALNKVKCITSKEPLSDHQIPILAECFNLERIESPVELLLEETSRNAVEVLKNLVKEGHLESLFLRVPEDSWDEADGRQIEMVEEVASVFWEWKSGPYFLRIQILGVFEAQFRSRSLLVEGDDYPYAVRWLHDYASEIWITNKESRSLVEVFDDPVAAPLDSVHYLQALPLYTDVYEWIQMASCSTIEWHRQNKLLKRHEFEAQLLLLERNLDILKAYDPLAASGCRLLLPNPTKTLPTLARVLPNLRAIGVCTGSNEELICQLIKIKRLWTTVDRVVVFTTANPQTLLDLEDVAAMIPFPHIEIRVIFPEAPKSERENALWQLPRELRVELLSYITDIRQLSSVLAGFPRLRELAQFGVKCITSEEPISRDTVLELVPFHHLQRISVPILISPEAAIGEAGDVLLKLVTHGKLREISLEVVSYKRTCIEPVIELLGSLVEVLEQRGAEKYIFRCTEKGSFEIHCRSKALYLRRSMHPFRLEKLSRRVEQLWTDTQSDSGGGGDSWPNLKCVHYLTKIPYYNELMSWLTETPCHTIDWHNRDPAMPEELANQINENASVQFRGSLEKVQILMLPHKGRMLGQLQEAFPNLIGIGIYSKSLEKFEQDWQKITAYWPNIQRVIVYVKDFEMHAAVKKFTSLEKVVSVEVRHLLEVHPPPKYE